MVGLLAASLDEGLFHFRNKPLSAFVTGRDVCYDFHATVKF